MGNRLILASLCAFLPAYAQVAVTITPSTADVSLGTFLQLSARVSGTSNTSVAWSVTLAIPTATGSPGAVSNAGRYTPPGAIPNPNVVFVTATSNADPRASATAALILGNPYPTVASVSPTFAPPGPATLTVNGSRFVPGAEVTVGDSPDTITSAPG